MPSDTQEFGSIEILAREVKNKLDAGTKKKVVALYAFNATGKTRLSGLLEDLDRNVNDEENDEKIKILRYSAFLEDVFHWDNENYVFKFDQNSWFIRLIKEQGLENNLAINFKKHINEKIEPSFDFETGEVIFRVASGDDTSLDTIKISRGEESVFIWSLFYSILEVVIDSLSTEIKENRTTNIFNELKYIVIDDPVSSIDDTKIISISLELIGAIKTLTNNDVRFLITTHHALFYNVVVNSLKRHKGCDFESFSFSKDGKVCTLTKQGDAPFAYHLSVAALIQKAIQDNSIEKYHFNLFRALLEKTANFLGYSSWDKCLIGESSAECIRLLNLYSHNRISELEGNELSPREKAIFSEAFTGFIQNFKYSLD